MFLAAAMAHYIALKVEYRHPQIALYEQQFYENAPQKNLKKKKLKRPFAEVQEEVHSQAV